MKKLLLILSITLGLTYTANANAVYECSLLDEGQPYAQMIKYENKFVEIFPTGEVEEFFCTSLPFNYTERPVCISRKDGIQENDYITYNFIYKRKEIFEDKFQKLSKISLQMSNLNISPSKASKFGIKIAKDGVFRTAEEILTQKDVNMSKIRDIWPEILNHGAEIDEQIEINSHYRGYLKKQKADILAFKRDENLSIPDNIDYDQFSGLSNEVKAKFKQIIIDYELVI